MNERSKTITLIGLILLFLSGVYLFQGYRHHINLIEQVIKITEDKFNSAIDSTQEFSFALYSIRINNLLTGDPGIVEAFANHDRDKLHQKTLSKYEALRAENKFFQVMHFHLPDGTTFLRMHNPDFWGDDLTEIRPIVAAVHRDKKALTGYEIGRHGPFYRIVQPVFYNGEYIGALEFGIQTRQLLDVLEKKVDAPVTSFFRNDFIQKATHFHENSSVKFGDFHLISREEEVFSKLPQSLELDKEYRRIVLGDQTYFLHSHPLFKNYQGELVGGILALQDITPFLTQESYFFSKSIVLILTLFGTAFIVLYFGFGKIMGSLVDEITKRKKAQEAATMAKKEWERTVDSIPDSISILDRNFRIIRTNKALPDFLGLSMEEVVGSPCYKIFCGKEKAPESCPYRALQRDKQMCTNEIYYERLHYYFDVILSPLYDENGDFVGAVHIARNISERKLLELEAHDNHLYLQSILKASTNTAIVATDAKMQIKYCNPEAERLLGYPVDTLINHSITEVHAHQGLDVSSRFKNAMDQVRQHGFYQFQLQRDDYTLDTQISSLTDEEGNFTGVLFIGRDVTAQKVAEKKLLKAEKFEAIGLMAGGVAHDLNNILSGIVSYPQLLRYQLPEDSDMQEPLLQIQKAGKRAADVVMDLLTMARGIAHTKEIVSLNDLVQEYLASPEYGKLSSLYPNITVKTQLDQECWNCRCSPTHIIKIVMNLVTNAIEAITDTGSVFISTSNQEGRPQQAGDSLEGHEFVVLQVQDTGPGIPENHLEHIFEPFYSTKKMGRSGSGLGLSIIWNTVQEHGGLVTVDSSKDGTVFTIYIPRCKEHADMDNDETADVLTPLTGEGTILIVDDDEDQRTIVQQMVSVLGYTAHTVISGEEVLIWFQNNNADLLLLDMVMSPGMSGRETYEKVIRLYPKQKALIASGLSKDSEVEKAFQLGVSGFIAKPYSLEELGRAIQRVLAG
jgi:PAS domain S-box-containing protein